MDCTGVIAVLLDFFDVVLCEHWRCISHVFLPVPFRKLRERGNGSNACSRRGGLVLLHGGSLAAVRFYYYMVARADHVREGTGCWLNQPTEMSNRLTDWFNRVCASASLCGSYEVGVIRESLRLSVGQARRGLELSNSIYKIGRACRVLFNPGL